MSLSWLAFWLSLVALAISVGVTIYDWFVLRPRRKELMRRLRNLEFPLD